MAQRRVFRALGATADLPLLAIYPAQAEKPRPAPCGAGDRPRDARQAPMRLSIPDEPIGDDRHMVGNPVPFAHQNGSDARERGRRMVGHVVQFRTQRAAEQPIQFSSDRSSYATVNPFLLRIRDAEGKYVAAKRSRRQLPEFARPQVTKFGARQAYETVEIELNVAAARHGLSFMRQSP